MSTSSSDVGNWRESSRRKIFGFGGTRERFYELYIYFEFVLKIFSLSVLREFTTVVGNTREFITITEGPR
jgi:hypothetical protein